MTWIRWQNHLVIDVLKFRRGKLSIPGVGDVSHGGSLHDVPDDELLDGLVLGASLGAVGAPHELDVATAMLVASIVSTLGCHVDSGIDTKYMVMLMEFVGLQDREHSRYDWTAKTKLHCTDCSDGVA